MINRKSQFRWVIAAVLFLSILLMQVSHACLASLFSEISRDIELSKSQMGMIVAMVPLSALIFSLMGGAISDRVGSRLAIGGALLIAAVSGWLRGFADTAIELASLTFVLGVAVALIPPNVGKVLGAWFSHDELGKANGLVVSAAPIGVAVGLGTGASLLSPTFGGWGRAMGFVAVMCLVMAVVWILVYREQIPDLASKHRTRNILGNLAEVLAIRDIWLVAAFSGCFVFALASLMGLLPVILEERGIGRAGQLAALFMLAAILGGPLGGMISDKVGRRKPFLMLSAVVFGICIPFFNQLTGIPLVAVLVIAGLAQGVILPMTITTLIEIKKVGAAHAATAIGLNEMIASSLGFLGPVVSGKLMDVSGSPLPAFVLMTGFLIVGACIVAPLKH